MNQKRYRLTVKTGMGLKICPPVFWTSSVLIVLFISLTLINVKAASAVFSGAKYFVCEYAGWFFVIAVNITLAYAFWLLFSRYGALRIGGQKAAPEWALACFFTAWPNPFTTSLLSPAVRPFRWSPAWKRASSA